jgi:hypothetical protein
MAVASVNVLETGVNTAQHIGYKSEIRVQTDRLYKAVQEATFIVCIPAHPLHTDHAHKLPP